MNILTAEQNHTVSKHLNMHCSNKLLSNMNVLAFKTSSNLPVQTNTFVKGALLGWSCNISENYKFSMPNKQQIQIKPTATHTQYALLCRLLIAGTCNTIYFDAQLSTKQLLNVRSLQTISGTKIVNAKIAYVFNEREQMQA